MNCPNCGNEIEENQNFCPSCGANLNTDNKIKQLLNNKTVKICLIILIAIVLIVGLGFGYKAHEQYKKDTAPLEIQMPFEYCSKCKLNTTYANKNITLILTTDEIIEDWQKEYYNEQSNNEITLTIKRENYEQKIDFSDITLNAGSPLSIEFTINNAKVSDFTKLKEVLSTKGTEYLLNMPTMFGFNPNNIKIAKKNYDLWIKEKEEQERLEKLRNEILSNCVYKTSDGICFTTQIFKAEPIKNLDKTYQEYDYWLGAKDACESKGYRLPNDDELRSLFSDILGIEVYSGIDVKSEKYSDSNIPTNFEILKKIAPKQEHDSISLWENEIFDNDRALARKRGTFWNDETYQYIADKYSYKDSYKSESTICVYDPNGKPHKSLLEITKEKELKIKQQEEQRKKAEQRKQQELMDNEAENTLF